MLVEPGSIIEVYSLILSMMHEIAILQWICLYSQTVTCPCHQHCAERRDNDPSTYDRNFVISGPVMGGEFEARLCTNGDKYAQPGGANQLVIRVDLSARGCQSTRRTS